MASNIPPGYGKKTTALIRYPDGKGAMRLFSRHNNIPVELTRCIHQDNGPQQSWLRQRKNIVVLAHNTYVEPQESGALVTRLINKGHSVQSLTDISTNSYSGALNTADMLIHPDIWHASHHNTTLPLDSATRSAIASFVQNGGKFVFMFVEANSLALTNSIFGFSLSEVDRHTVDIPRVSKQPRFVALPATLPITPSLACVGGYPVETEVIAAYSAGHAGAFAVPYGQGEVIYLGYNTLMNRDDYSSVTQHGRANMAWVSLIDALLQ